jgi:TRAP-type C4-dicarboxylate transport system permease small subunit
MKSFIAGVIKVDKVLYAIAGVVLALMILLTLCDVISRNFGHPITGSLEIIQYAGSIVFGFSIPYATWLKVQVIVDLIIEKISKISKRNMNIITRCIGILLTLFISCNFFLYGWDVLKTGELTASFKIPYYPFVFALSFSFLMHSFTIICDLLQTIRPGTDDKRKRRKR